MAMRREQVQAMYFGLRQDGRTIARALHVSDATISRDIAYLMAEHRKRFEAAKDEHRARELADLEEMEADCARQWENTHKEVWLRHRLEIKRRRAAYMGLDAAQLRDVTLHGSDLLRAVDDEIARLEVEIKAAAKERPATDEGHELPAAGTTATP